MCLYPTLIRNRKYTKTKKNGGIIPAISDKRILAIPIGCGRCIECRNQKRREWQVRLLEDVKHNKNGIFITLTFSNESIKEISEKIDESYRGYERDNEIATKATRLFLERWRKANKKSVRHWLVTELGHNGTENIHMHGIIWTDKGVEEIKRHWKYGYIWGGYEGKENYVNEKTVNYITKYISKEDKDHKEYNSKILTSAGIGKGYKGKKTQDYYKTKSGHKVALPKYMRNKLLTEGEREKKWIEMLDKNERWVRGERIDVSKGDEEYWKAVEYRRLENKKLGYGDNTRDWNRKKYEEQRRDLLMQERIENTQGGFAPRPPREAFALDETKPQNAIKWGNNNDK